MLIPAYLPHIGERSAVKAIEIRMPSKARNRCVQGKLSVAGDQLEHGLLPICASARVFRQQLPAAVESPLWTASIIENPFQRGLVDIRFGVTESTVRLRNVAISQFGNMLLRGYQDAMQQ
jgi:hypothetical protein